MALVMNGKVCNELVINTATLPELSATQIFGNLFGTSEVDPSNTLWVNHWVTAGGEEDAFRGWWHLDSETERNIMLVMSLEGEQQAMEWCKNIYDANGIADLAGQDGNVCCQYWFVNRNDPESEVDLISVAVTTATSLVDLEGAVTYTEEDDNEVEQTYDVSIGAVIFDASVPLVFEEEEEVADEEGASLNTLKWGALALSTLMLAQ